MEQRYSFFCRFNVYFCGKLDIILFMNKRSVVQVFIFCYTCLVTVCGCSNDLPIEEPKFLTVLKSDSLIIESSVETPRRSEGDFLQLKDGSILAVYTRFVGGVSDHSKAVLSGRISIDGGVSWNEESDIITNEGNLNVMSVSLLRLHSDSIAMFYLIKNSETDCYPVMRVSGDEGKKWSESRSCQAPGNGYHVLNNSRVRQLQSGRLLVPVSLHAYRDSQFEADGTIFCFYSDDNGFTWQKSRTISKPSGLITQEPGVVELKDGRVLMYMRTNWGYQYYSYSSDSGKSWSYAKESSLHSAQSPALIVRNPFNQLLVAVWNDSRSNKRTPLCIAISANEGQTWENEYAVENNRNLWFCYPAVVFPDTNTILLSYSFGPEEHWGFGSFKFSRLRSWLFY